MTITTGAQTTLHLTESQLEGLALRFEIRSDRGIRRFYVDGVEVGESRYHRAMSEAVESIDDEPEHSKGIMHDADDESLERWAEHYDDLNGAPENDEDR